MGNWHGEWEPVQGMGTSTGNQHHSPLGTGVVAGKWDLVPPGSGEWEQCQLALAQELCLGLGTSLMNWECYWELGFGIGVAQAPGSRVIWETGPPAGTGTGTIWMGNWDGGPGLLRHQRHRLGSGNWDQCLDHLGTGTSHWDLPGTGTCTSTETSVAMALDTGTRSHWPCLGPDTRTGNWANWSTVHQHQWALHARATQAPGAY